MISNMTLILVLMTALAFVLVLCDEVAGGHGGRMACSAAVGGFDGAVFGHIRLGVDKGGAHPGDRWAAGRRGGADGRR